MNNRNYSNGRKSQNSFGRSGRSRGRFSNSRRKSSTGDRIDISKFINKAVITETEIKFVPNHTFSDFLIEEKLKKSIAEKGYIIPTPIQDQAIPVVLEGRDILGIANTGTGKTGAFLIPLINKVIKNKRENILIIVPTRELAIQVEQEMKDLTKGMRIFSVCTVGGMNIRKQMSQLRYEYNFIIGTPGRLKDLVNRKMIYLNEFNTVVLDEADRMLDMGFINEMREVVAAMPKERQTLFFSATLSSEIQKLVGDFLNNPVSISVKKGDTAKNVDQDVVRIAKGQDKIEVLHELLIQEEFNKVLIFGKTKHGVEKLSISLEKRGFRAESIHGDKNHSQRQKALKNFKDNHSQILVATDVAARGLDIADVSHVINFDLPQTYEDYVHRIGRTGRADKKGKALTFIG
jgi:ATP-dependent RNA helicase RhlE